MFTTLNNQERLISRDLDVMNEEKHYLGTTFIVVITAYFGALTAFSILTAETFT